MTAHFLFFRRCFGISAQEHQINEEIRDPQVRLIGVDGEQLGIVTVQEALEQAISSGFDLVKIAPQATPPVCKIMDYGKFRFEQSKKDKEARKNQHIVDIKEIRLSAKIDIHDFDFKVRNALKFLKSGDKVKVSVRFRGREMAHTEIGLTILERFAEACSEYGTTEKEPKLEGRQMAMFLSPGKSNEKKK